MALGCGAAPEPQDTSVGFDSAMPPEDASATPLLLTFSWHLEGWDLSDPAIRDRYMGELLPAAHQQLDAHGVKATLEIHDDLVRHLQPDDLTPYLAAGHQVLVHADLGGNSAKDYTQDDFVRDLTSRRARLEDHVGPVHGVSGVCSHLDWVAASRDAGFRHIAGNVAYCAAGMTSPPVPYDQCENAGECHGLLPEELEQRLAPWRLADVNGWLEDDPAGDLVLLPSSGSLPCFAEERSSQEDSPTGCTFRPDDIDAFVAELDSALALHEAERGVRTFNVIWSFGQPPPEGVFEAWLTEVDPYVASGRVAWATATAAIETWQAGR